MMGFSPFPLAIDQGFFPLLAIFGVLTIPVVSILARHQQRMAELMSHRMPSSATTSENDSLREEVRELKNLVSSLAITVDNMSDRMDNRDRIEARIKVSDN